MTNSIRIERAVPMAMRDGTLLRADVYRPYDKERHPAILMRSPYGRPMTMDFSFLNLVDTVTAGYALVVQNIRGVRRCIPSYRRV
jgi:predicted acyl esterase